MKELEEVQCEIRRVVDFQLSVSDRLNNVEADNGGTTNLSQRYSDLEGPTGGFLKDATYAWLSYGCHLVVLNVKTGESSSSWTFRGKVTCVGQLPTQPGESPVLLVGLDNEALRIKDSMGMICVFDCGTSRVLRAIKMPAGVEQVCIVSGGTEWEESNDNRLDDVLSEMNGIAFIALRNLHHIMIDLRRSEWDISNPPIVMDESLPADMDLLRSKDYIPKDRTHGNKHAAFNLLNSRIENHIGFNREEFESTALLGEKLTNTILSSTKIGCLISGTLGRVIIWQNDGSIGWISSPVDECMTVTHLSLLEPTDDPRPFYYMWVVFQDESSKAPPLLRMYALLFERKYCDRGTNLYFNLEADPSVKFEFELDGGDRVISLSTIERETNSDQAESEARRGEDNLLLITTCDRTLLFDLNQWYKEQMPQTINECKNSNSILASYCVKLPEQNATPNRLSSTYIPGTLQEFPNNSPNSPEELFFPNSLSLEWVELSLTKLIFWVSRGIQVELLREMAKAGPIILTQPAATFHKCLSVGLVPFNSEVSFTADQNAQREMLLSVCLEQRWATFLVRCAKEWSDGSASYLYPSFLKWGIQRAAAVKMIADRLCVPLFDQSGNNAGDAEIKTLRFCSQQLECLSNVVGKLPIETADLDKQRRALKRVSAYFQVLLWFYDVGLLPESQDWEEGPLPMSLELKIPYPLDKLIALYREKRESIKKDQEKNENEEWFFIDELISRDCPSLKLQWEREAGDGKNDGHYPPPSLQSLLRSYLADSHQTELNEIECKHQITIYLLMDLAMLLQGSYPGVDQLIKYPSAFKMRPSLIKLTQAFWLLDHEDYQGFLDMMTGQFVSDSDVKDWHHKHVLRTLVRNNQHKLALMYLRIRKPPLSSVDDQSTLISLSVEHGLVQSAFHHRPQSHYAQLLIGFFQACKTYGKLSDILHLALDPDEEEVFVKFLENDTTSDMRLLYYLQRCRYTEANNGCLINRSNTSCPKDARATSFTILNAYNATLPGVIKRFTVNMGRTNLDVDLESRYPRPMSHSKSCNKILSLHETVIRKAKETYLRGEKSQIPFISAPCSSLKFNDVRANMNCVLFPKSAQKNRKRTLDQANQYEDDGTKTPDRAKRRRLDDGEAESQSNLKDMTLNVALSTPLVKRSINTAGVRDSGVETPHSILKIRQLIRSSTSPCVATAQTEFTDSPSSDREKKANRQIRFNISKSMTNNSIEDHTVEEESIKHDVSDSEDVILNQDINSKSYSETAILSDSSSYNKSNYSKNMYSPRSRPSLRRTCMETSNKLVQESPVTFSKATNFANSTPALGNFTPSKQTRRYNSMLSASIYSPAILSCDSSYETTASYAKCEQTNLRNPQQFSRQDDNYEGALSSPQLTQSSTPKDSCDDFDEAMDVEEDKEMEFEVSYGDTQKLSEDVQANHSQLKEKVRSSFKNGDVAKRKDAHQQGQHGESEDLELKGTIRRDDETRDASDVEESSLNEDNNAQEEQFASFPNSMEESVYQSEKGESGGSVPECINVNNSENFDITDDESSRSVDNMVSALEETCSSVTRERVGTPMDNYNYNSNITDDESDTSINMDESEMQSITLENRQESTYKRSRSSITIRENVTTSKTRNKSLTYTVNNNANPGETEAKSRFAFSENVDSDREVDSNKSVGTPKQSSLLAHSLQLDHCFTPGTEVKDESFTRVTRSRRASSVAKETSSPVPVVSPSKAMTAEKVKRTRRASSLMKEVLSASILGADEIRKQTDSPSTSSPKKSRTRRASSVVKDISDAAADDSEDKVPVRRSTRRAASVQKELPSETIKPLTRRLLSSSNIQATNEEEKTERKTAKEKSAASGGRKPSVSVSTSSSKSTKSSKSKTSEESEEKDNIKPRRGRGSSVPKEATVATSKTRRLSSVDLQIEAIPENVELPQGTTREQRSVTTKEVKNPVRNTRSRTSSIRSVPEELEEILSVPSKERLSTAVGKKQRTQNLRQRRAASVEITQLETKKSTRNVRGRSILEETITEEDTAEIEDPGSSKTEIVRTVSTRRKRATSETVMGDAEEKTLAKPRRGRRASINQETNDKFLFSQPEKSGDLPLDQKAIGEIPNYVFSPPHTRSKNTDPNQHRRRLKKFISIMSEGEGKKKGIVQGTSQVPRSSTYVPVIVSRYRTKFVLPKKSNSMSSHPKQH